MVCCIAAAVLVGCTSDSKGNGLNLGTTPAASSTSTTITIAATTTTTTMVTVAPTVEGRTTAATKNPTTSSATPPTTDTTSIATAPATVEARVEADYLAARQVRQRCSYEPESCDYAAFAVPGSPLDVETRDKIKGRLAANLRAVDGFGDVKERVESVFVSGELAHLTACAYDTVVIFDVADPTNSADNIIFNDEKGSYRVRWELHLEGGRWLIASGETLDKLSGGDLCGF